MKSVRVRWFGFLIAIAGVCFLTYFYGFRVNSANTKVYEDLSRFSITDVSKLKGNYFILHFWAKWCEPCLEEIPTLIEFAQKAKFEKPIFVLAVSLDPTLEEAKQILPEKGLNLPPYFILALDSTHKYSEAVGSYQYPESYFIGPDGEVIEKWVGPQKWNKPEVIEYFKSRIH